MSNKSSNQSSGQGSGKQSQSLSLGQIGRDEALLLPVPPSSTVDEIVQLVRNGGSQRVELLVPNDTTALQSIAGNETLREAARAAGIHVTIFTSDEKTTHAARFAKLDVIGVGGAVAAPKPGATPRRPTGQFRAVQAPPPVTPRPPAAQTQQMPAPSASQSAPQPPTPAPGPASPDFFSQLDAFDQAAPAPPRPQMGQSEGGAMLYDAPGESGTQRPANNDDEWAAAFGALDDTMSNEPPADLPPPPRATRRSRPAEPSADRLERPSLFGALLGRMPGRQRRAAVADPDADDGMMRMSRPDRSPEEEAVRRRQSRSLLLWPLAVIGVVLAAVALGYYALNGSFNLGGRPTVVITPPLNSTETIPFPNQIVPLVTEPITGEISINVQGQLVTVDESHTVQGTASQTQLAPIGFARGTIILRNRSSQPVPIAAGTPINVANQRFLFENDVTVPASAATDVGITFGVAEASLVSETAGAQGNIPPGTITEIPSLSGTILVQQSQPFAGGTDQEVRFVSVEDVNQVLPQAVDGLYEKGVQSITRAVQQIPGFELVMSDTTGITPTRETLRESLSEDQIQLFPPLGQVTEDGTFSVQVSQTFAALAAPSNIRIEDQIQRAVTAQIRQVRPDLQNARIDIQGWRRIDNGGGQQLAVDAVAVPPGGYQPVSDDLQAEIAQNLVGLTREEAQAYLDSLQAENRISAFTLPEEITEPIPENVQINVAADAAGAQ